MCSKNKILTYSASNSLFKDYPEALYNSLLGLTVSNRNIVVLESHQIIMRRDHHLMKNKVKIIGGGGAGIEPAETNYVGKGMLTAAVLGEKYSAPSAEEILVAVRELAQNNPNGILLLVKNYFGDKLNFGLALDRAVNENIKVKMLIIGDDIVEICNSQQGRKGLAGCVLVYKIVGEMAEQEKTLEEIIDECRKSILTRLVTVSVTLPSNNSTFCESLRCCIQPDELVFGMGIYGQPGYKKMKISNLKEIVSVVLNDIFSYLKIKYNNSENFEKTVDVMQRKVILVNNLGSTSILEENIIVKEVSDQLFSLGIKIALFYAGKFMSSCNSNGFSISILDINSDDTLQYLDAPTSALGWPSSNQSKDFFESSPSVAALSSTIPTLLDHATLNKSRYENIPLGPDLSEKASAALKQITMFAAEALISCEKQLNIINSETGDSDTGTVLRRGAEAVKVALINDSLNVCSSAKFFFDISDICSNYMGGITGALYKVFFSSAGKVFLNAKEITPQLCASAFQYAVKAIKLHGKAELGDRTLLDALHPAAESFEYAISNGKSLTEAMYLAAATCEFKTEKTKFLKPPWFNDLGVESPLIYPDAGAHAATIWLRAISEGLKLTYPKRKLGLDESLFITLLNETYKYARKNFNHEPRRISALVGTVYYTHLYFTSSQWKTSSEVYYYFRESILCQTVELPPKSTEIFTPEEAKDALIFFLKHT